MAAWIGKEKICLFPLVFQLKSALIFTLVIHSVCFIRYTYSTHISIGHASIHVAFYSRKFSG